VNTQYKCWLRRSTPSRLARIILFVALPVLHIASVSPFGDSVPPAHASEAEVPKPSFERIDAHAHALGASQPLYDMLKRVNMGLITISVVNKHDLPIHKEEEPQQQWAREVSQKSEGRVVWISTFDPRGWEQPGFADRVIKHLEQTFKDGAVGVKIYKDIGMELKWKDGRWLMPDDPVFDPILDYIAAKGKTLYAHIADPKEAWDPPGSNNTFSKDNDYAYNLYGRTDHPPSKEQILAARDHLMQKHPNLRVVGCHLGSMEDDVDEIAKRFDRYPNFVVDTGARVDEFMLQPREKVRAFLIKYQDRVLYGVDEQLNPWDDKTPKDQEEHLKEWETFYANDWKYFATTETVKVMSMSWPSRNNQTVQGLGLPDSVLHKFFHDNAMKWVIDPQSSNKN
jgi:predicted TIM-barrel fold metal-dependent hydrolase